jgi:hypothetical protein
MNKRADRVGDLWAAILTSKRSLKRPLERLRALVENEL